jgi:hypothetical protein
MGCRIIWALMCMTLGRGASRWKGMVLTVEPGIYIEEEQMGIRIENDVWITSDGNKDLMGKVPITAGEMKRR